MPPRGREDARPWTVPDTRPRGPGGSSGSHCLPDAQEPLMLNMESENRGQGGSPCGRASLGPRRVRLPQAGLDHCTWQEVLGGKVEGRGHEQKPSTPAHLHELQGLHHSG